METLSLDLNSQQAACLILLLDTSLDTLQNKAKILKEIKALPIEQRPPGIKDDLAIDETIKVNDLLAKDCIQFLQEVSAILKELDSDKPEPLIIKPDFKHG